MKIRKTALVKDEGLDNAVILFPVGTENGHRCYSGYGFDSVQAAETMFKGVGGFGPSGGGFKHAVLVVEGVAYGTEPRDFAQAKFDVGQG